MSYANVTELAFASGYYHIGPKGVVTLKENTPPEIRRKFWETWPLFRETALARQRKGIWGSAYPLLPETDPEENVRQYEEEMAKNGG